MASTFSVPKWNDGNHESNEPESFFVDPQVISSLAHEFFDQSQGAVSLGINAEPEAQLTTPIATLFIKFTAEAGLGKLRMLREAQLDGVRPDFAATIDDRPCGWVELKAPGHSLDGERWRGREKDQWNLLSQLDSLIVTNGEQAILYSSGSPVAHCNLPFSDPASWEAEPFQALLQQFILARPAPIIRVSQLAARLAPLARFIRAKLDQGLEGQLPAVLEAKQAWDVTVHETTSSEQFSSDVAQVISYAMAIAGLSGEADLNQDGSISLKEAKEALTLGHKNVLAAALGPILGIPELLEYIGPEVGAVVRLVSSLNADAIQSSKDARGEPWLWFYEDFLAKYDPDARKQSGVYYTPTSVVELQVRVVDDLLRNTFGQRLGFGSKSVITLDPAAGSGTYPIAVIDKAVETAFAERGPAGSKQVAENLSKNILAFELLPGPYAVSHLRIGQRLAQAKGQLVQVGELGVYLTDTLEDPSTPSRQGLFGDAKILAEAAQKARHIKAEQPITVAIGNPPYDRVSSDSGGWVTSGDQTSAPLFDDVIKPAQENGVVFSAQASLYNLYVYFWRWAMWKVFQTGPDGKSVISFITGSSWLDGPAFVGLRKLAVATASEIWIIDLGGEGRGARKDDNVFDIQSPVAIVTLVRSGKASKPATIRYRRVHGTRSEKFAQLDEIGSFDPNDPWSLVEAPNGEKFIPPITNEAWNLMPLVTDIFPWQQPGMMYNRMWPVAPSPSVLERRWRELLSEPDADTRAQKFVTAKTGRNIHTRVGDLPSLASLSQDSPHLPIVRMGWRSFDQQWTFNDPRVANLERPALWQSLSERQLFLITPWTARISSGPAATVSTGVPDKHYFRGSYGGKDVIPLYRDAESKEPNINAGLLKGLSARLGQDVCPEDLLAYTYAVLAHDGYSAQFHEELETSPVRLPMTTDTKLFNKAVQVGKELLWLQTFGHRYTDDERQKGFVPHIDGLYWVEPVTVIPESTKNIRYDEDRHELHVGDGVISGVIPAVRQFSVSGMNILDKWLGARTHTGTGRASGKTATPLDRIRPDEWEDQWNDELLDLLRVLTRTVELGPVQEDLLHEILASELVGSQDLPAPSAAEKKVPKTIKRNTHQTAIDGRS